MRSSMTRSHSHAEALFPDKEEIRKNLLLNNNRDSGELENNDNNLYTSKRKSRFGKK